MGVQPSHRNLKEEEMEGTFRYDEREFVLSTFETNSKKNAGNYSSWFNPDSARDTNQRN